MAPPLVSVLVPVFNGARHLDEALLSIRSQTYRRLQILVRDDGSGDDSVEIARAHAEQDPRVTIVDGEPSGNVRANHIALAELATGRFAKFCHQDDMLDRAHVATLAKALTGNPNITVATSPRHLIDATGARVPTEVAGFAAPLSATNTVMDGPTVIRHSIASAMNWIGEPSVVLFRNKLVPPERMFCWGDQEYTMLFDLVLWFNLLRRGAMYYHATALSSFRRHEHQLSSQGGTLWQAPLEFIALLRHATEVGLAPSREELQVFRSVVGETLQARYRQLSQSDNEQLRAEYLPRYAQALREVNAL